MSKMDGSKKDGGLREDSRKDASQKPDHSSAESKCDDNDNGYKAQMKLVEDVNQNSFNDGSVEEKCGEDSCFNDSDKFRNDEVITMVDVLNDQQALEDADYVIGTSVKECSYSKGYMKRQMVYSCISCYEITETVAALCLACSLKCHENCELVELYTKRNLRCDCGNSKFFGKKCTLNPEKSPENELNFYNNKNFKGLFCACSKPYPDPENTDDMLQCIVCEDWYHSGHLKNKPPATYSEMICDVCCPKLEFLSAYSKFTAEKSVSTTSAESADDTLETSCVDNSLETCRGIKRKLNCDERETHDALEIKLQSSIPSHSKQADEISILPVATATCFLDGKKLEPFTGATYWTTDWRKELCRCNNCQELYRKQNVEFLLDNEDTVSFYEEQRDSDRIKLSLEDLETSLISSLPLNQRIEMIERFNDMKLELSDYLNEFAKNNKVVNENDIREFFKGLKERQKIDMPPSTCR